MSSTSFATLQCQMGTSTELSSIKPYGEEVEIDEDRCINHVGKWLGSALCHVVADCRKRGNHSWQQRQGLLTQNATRKPHIHCNQALRGNNTGQHEEGRLCFHLPMLLRRGESEEHQNCPTLRDSWCFFQAAVAQHKVPGPHDRLIYTPLNYAKLKSYLQPVYQRMSYPHLLERCVSRRTQNARRVFPQFDIGQIHKGQLCFARACAFCSRNCSCRIQLRSLRN